MTTRDQLLFGAAGAALIAAALAVWLLIASGTGAQPLADPDLRGVAASAGIERPAASSTAAPTSLLIDVEGGVERPGVVEMRTAARIGDAIAAAGGYSKSADVLAAAASLNLAAPLTDGQQVYVPMIGVANPPASGGTSGTSGGAAGGLVNINQASPEELDALPGIGPVTVQKIVAARQEQPFTSLEELIERKVLNNGQLEKVRDMVTVS